MKRLSTVLLLIGLAAASVWAEADDIAALKVTANGYYQAADWKNAEAAYAKITAAEPENFGASYRYGFVLLNLGKTEAARPRLEFAMEKSPNPVFAIALARVYARLGEKTKAFDVLEKANTLGGISADSFAKEKDFDALRNDEKFIEIVKKGEAIVNPCNSTPEYRQFDFWIGEWAPKNVQGITVGTSSIQLILNKCVIFENWETPLTSGKSFSNYDATDKKWHQTWVDTRGTLTHYDGGLVNGEMVLVNDTTTSGKRTLAKMTFSKITDGNVRQHGENSTDGGKTWVTTFDFIYVKAK